MAVAPHRASRHLSTSVAAGLQAEVFMPYCPIRDTAGHCFWGQFPLPLSCHCSHLCLELTSKQGYQQGHPQPQFADHSPWHPVTQGSGTMSHSFHQPLHFRSQKQLLGPKAGGGVSKSEPGVSRKAKWGKQSWRYEGLELSTPQQVILPSC